MCGFGGIINSTISVNKHNISNIAKMVSFRGPDNTNVNVYDSKFNLSDEGCHAIFFNRLAIIDLDPRANQPFEDKEHLLVFNGEIYNYLELKERLKKRGFLFRTTSDTEVLFVALKFWGTHAIEKLNGMFAFCFINKVSGHVIMAKDRTGIKSLYYAFNKTNLIFASELDSIIRLSREALNVSSNAISHFLALQYVPTPLSILEGVKKLPPGHFLETYIYNQDITNEPPIVPFFDVYNTSSDACFCNVEELEELLTNSLSSQLRSDVPLGLFLSSGIDSSLLAAILNKHNIDDGDLKFFTVAFNEMTDADESKDASDFLKSFKNDNFRHFILQLDHRDIIRSMPDIYNILDEPFADPAFILNYAISRKARDHVTVVLSGDGGDELFWGYTRYNQWADTLREHKKFFFLKYFKVIFDGLPESKIFLRLKNKVELDPLRLYQLFITSRYWGKRVDLRRSSEIWANENLKKIIQHDQFPSYYDLKSYLPDCMHYKVDRSSMAHGLEVRVPYLDNHVIRFALNLSLQAKTCRKYPTKAPLKLLLNKLAPNYSNNLINIKKGFSSPLQVWISKYWKEHIYEVVTQEVISDLGLDAGFVCNILDGYFRGEHSSYTDIWYIFNLASWYNKFRRVEMEKRDLWKYT